MASASAMETTTGALCVSAGADQPSRERVRLAMHEAQSLTSSSIIATRVASDVALRWTRVR
jgi:F420-0:gamma-glutamyl ligase